MKVVFFIDDVNMPARERYGAQPPIELLRQFQDFRGLYDRKQLFWRDIEDVTLCAACGPPGGGRQDVTPRSVSLLHASQAVGCVGCIWLQHRLDVLIGSTASSGCRFLGALQVLPALHHAGNSPTIRHSY